MPSWSHLLLCADGGINTHVKTRGPSDLRESKEVRISITATRISFRSRGQGYVQSSYVGSVLGKVPVQFFQGIKAIGASDSFETKVTIQSAAKSNIQG